MSADKIDLVPPHTVFKKGFFSSTGDRSHRGKIGLLVLLFLVISSLLTGLLIGALPISLTKLMAKLWHDGFANIDKSRDYIIIFEVRLPRILMGMLVGAALAVSGVMMQGLFRNPLADPGIMGVSLGAGLGAVLIIVLGNALPSAFQVSFGPFAIVVGAFGGGLATTVLLYFIATSHGRTSIANMLLAGIAMAALNGALMGYLVFRANDIQLRDINFWGLGSLAGATWARIAIAAPFIMIGLLLSPLIAKALNALALGEAVAAHLGFQVQYVKNLAIFLVALMCGAAVSISGGIGFIGIVVPHILRMTIGPDHRFLLPCSALLGASLLVFADSLCRVLVAPAELPIGILTALFGAPFFLWILLRRQGNFDG